MNIPVLGETVALTNLSCIAIAVRPIVPFYESSINRIAYCRGFYRSLNFSFAAKDCSQINFHDPAFLAYLVNRGIFQTLRWNTSRTFGAARFACMRWCHFLAVSLQNRLFIRFILVRGNQIHRTTTGSFLKIHDKLANVFFSAFTGYNADYQAMFGVISHVIPIVSLLTVSRFCAITMFFFLAHKGPFLIKLHLIGSRGKTLPTHHEAPLRVRRRQGYNVLPCLDALLQDGWSYGHHSLRTDALTNRSFSSQIVAVQTAVCLFVQKIAFCMFGSTAVGYGYSCHTSRILSDYLRRVFHNPGIFYSDNRILKELALSCLPNVSLYGTTTCPSFRISAGQHKFIQY